jgi:hypothetical protein
LHAYRDYVIRKEENQKRIRERQNELAEQFHREYGEVPPFACKGGKRYKTDEPYTDEEVARYEAYSTAWQTFREENEEYAKLDKKLWNHDAYKDEDKLREKIAMGDAEAFMQDHPDSHIVLVSYADDGGDALMEHGNIFRNLPYVQISHH